MNIVVCIKQVPFTTDVKLDPKTNRVIRDGIPSIINPDDKSGLESAIKLKDELGAKVTVISMGPPQAYLAIREALAMGADEGILVSDRAFGGADTWATSTTLAAALKKIDYDLIITGRQAIDGDTAQVGPQIAEHLKLANISYGEEIRIDGECIIVKSQYEDRYHTIKAKLPVLITVMTESNKPRYMTPGGIFDAYREKTVTVWTLEDLDVDIENIGSKGSLTKVENLFTKGSKSDGKVFKLGPLESAELIVDKIKEKFIL